MTKRSKASGIALNSSSRLSEGKVSEIAVEVTLRKLRRPHEFGQIKNERRRGAHVRFQSARTIPYQIDLKLSWITANWDARLVRSGSFTTGPNRGQTRPCPLCPRKRQ
jgi:hypothetical protein